MSFQTNRHRRNYHHDLANERHHLSEHIHEYDEEIDETEDDLIGNYLYLTKHCGVLRHSPTTSILDIHHHHQSNLVRQFSLDTEPSSSHDIPPSKSSERLNDFNNNNYTSRIPPTIYYHENNEDDDRSFSLMKLFARMKTRLHHDRRYRLKSTHQLLHEEDSPEWFELTKNIRTVLTKALLPNGGYDAQQQQQQHKSTHHRRNSKKNKARDYDPVVLEEEEKQINLEIDDELNTQGDENFDQVIWKNFLQCTRGFTCRRHAICKAIDRQQFQGQLVYVYGVANNILIDENLKASGLG